MHELLLSEDNAFQETIHFARSKIFSHLMFHFYLIHNHKQYHEIYLNNVFIQNCTLTSNILHFCENCFDNRNVLANFAFCIRFKDCGLLGQLHLECFFCENTTYYNLIIRFINNSSLFPLSYP